MYYDVQKSAERIRGLRTGSNLTQSEAAEQCHYGKENIQQGMDGKGVLIFLEVIEKAMKVRYNKLSDKCNLLKTVQTEEI